MAKMSGKAAIVSLDDSAGSPQLITHDVSSYEIEWKYPPMEVTGMTEPLNYIPGALVTGVTLNLFWNSAATLGAWTVVKGIVNSSSSKTISITPEGTGTVNVFSGEFMCDGVTLSADASPGKPLMLGAVHFSPMGTTSPTWS
jgi:hypothetical protein